MPESETSTNVYSSAYYFSIIESFINYVAQEKWIQSIHGFFNSLGAYYVLHFLVDYIPIYYCFYKFVKRIYVRSSENKRQFQVQVDKIEKEIESTKAKISECNSIMRGRLKELDTETDKFLTLRTTVRAVIETNPNLKKYIDDALLSQPSRTEDQGVSIIYDILRLIKINQQRSRSSYSSPNSNVESKSASSLTESYSDDATVNKCSKCHKSKLDKMTKVACNIKHHLNEWHETLDGVVKLKHEEFIAETKVTTAIEKIYTLSPLPLPHSYSNLDLGSGRMNLVQVDDVCFNWAVCNQHLYASGDYSGSNADDNDIKYIDVPKEAVDDFIRNSMMDRSFEGKTILDGSLTPLVEETNSQMNIYENDDFTGEFY